MIMIESVNCCWEHTECEMIKDHRRDPDPWADLLIVAFCSLKFDERDSLFVLLAAFCRLLYEKVIVIGKEVNDHDLFQYLSIGAGTKKVNY